MNEKQQQLTFEKGITNVPSDAICSDNALAESVGMVYDDGEHRVIQKPKEKEDIVVSGDTLLFVHKHGSSTSYIVEHTDKVCWKDGSSYVEIAGCGTGNVSIEAIGNTVIVANSDGLTYALWTGSTYKVLGNKIPELTVDFSLDDFTDFSDKIGTSSFPYAEKVISLEGMVEGIVVLEISQNPDVYYAGNKFVKGQYESAKSGLIGLASSRLNSLKELKRFAFPFWARSAVRLFDGTHIYISNPQLLLPTVLNNWKMYVADDEGGYKSGYGNDKPGGWAQTNYMPMSAKLYYKINVPSGVNLQDWADIIGGVDIFVSDEAKSFDMEGSWTIQNIGVTVDGTFSLNPIFNGNTIIEDWCIPLFNSEKIVAFNASVPVTNKTYYMPSLYTESELIRELLDKSVFYKIVEHDLGDISSGTTVDAASKMEKHTLKTLTTQTQLETDDYFSHSDMYPQVMKAYNSRLHLANVERSIFKGFKNFSFTSYTNQQSHVVDYYVYIKTESGERIVKQSSASKPEIVDVWFYYPDPRAYKVVIYWYHGGNAQIATLSLAEHKRLNGAYYFGKLPTANETYEETMGTTPPAEIPDNELLPDQLIVSEVNNPFLFNASGYVTIGMGAIIGSAAQTVALGQEEHGIHPLIVFSEKGISTLRLGNDGTYLRSDELSREVCNSAKSITETDGAVFFSSEKGLMVIVGNQVKCVSEQLSGKSGSPFVEFLRNAVIAYDYRDSLLWIMKPDESYSWVYSIKSGTFSHYLMSTLVPEQASPSPSLQAAPRRSASEQNTSYIGWPVMSFTGIDSEGGSNQGTVVESIALNYLTRFNKFALKGYNSQEVIIYQLNFWEFEGHVYTDYNSGNDARTDTIFYNRSNSHYYVYIDGSTDLLDLGTTDPTTGALSVSPSSLSFVAAGESKTLTITSNGNWTISDNCNWLSYSANSGSGNATITVTAGENPNTSQRNATISVGGTGLTTQTISVTQEAAQPSGDYLNVTPQVLGFGKSSESKAFDISSNTSWSLSMLEPGILWVHVSANSGTGNGQITVSVDANENAASRQATIIVTDGDSLTRTIVVAQSGNANWSQFSVSPVTLSFAGTGEPKTIFLTCDFAWEIVKNVSWLEIDPYSGSNSDTISVEAKPNRTINARQTTLELIGGGLSQTITISQEEGTPAVLSVSPSSLSFNAEGGSPTLDVTSDVDWSISAGSGTNWLTSVSPDSHTNSGSQDVTTVTVVAPANTGENQRTGTLIISDGYGTEVVVRLSQAGNNPEPPTPTEYSVNVVNDYPDSLIQVDSKVYSLMERVNINNDNGTYSGTIETRPMKLENAQALKSIMQIMHVKQMQGTMTMRIFASNNLDNWVELHSLRGTPWKYYKFRFNFSDMKATDRFAGTMLITQERRTNKLR